MLAPILGDPDVMRFSLKGALSYEESKDYLQRNMIDHQKTHGISLYAVIHKQDNKLIGFCGLIHQEVDGQDCIELGYRLAKEYWKQGLATEAALAVRNYAFQLKIPKLISIIEPDNIASIRVAEKIGMQVAKETQFKGFFVKIYECIPAFSENML